MTEFAIKDSGARKQFDSGMVRDTDEGKINFLSVRIGPMFARWAAHLTKGRAKYPDIAPGVPNWSLADGEAELIRARESAARHFESWLNNELDEDHAAGVYFNINLAEYVKAKIAATEPIIYAPPGTIIEYDQGPCRLRMSSFDMEGTYRCKTCKKRVKGACQ